MRPNQESMQEKTEAKLILNNCYILSCDKSPFEGGRSIVLILFI